MNSVLDRRSFWLLAIGVVAALFATANLPWHLDDYDQAKQAFTSYEIVEQNHWLYQHTPNQWIATKPPLVAWISAGLFAVTRSWEIAWRLPSLLAAAALLFYLNRAASAAYGFAAGMLAVSACALNLFAPRLATFVRTDMPLALVIFLIGAQIWGKVRAGTRWTSRDRLIAFALLTAAMLIKGPIVYAFLLPGIIAFTFLRRRFGLEASAWCGWWPWIVSLFIFIAWVAYGIYSVPEFFEHVVIREFGGRFEGTHRAQPIYFYAVHLLYRFAPWSALLALFPLVQPRAKLRQVSAETLWLICWCVGAIVVMSVVPSKRVDRIFPVVPPLCLLLAAQFDERRRAGPDRLINIVTLTALAVAIVLSATFSISRINAGYQQHRDAYAIFGRAVRAEIAARRLRLAVIGGEDEGMLLYLRAAEFSEPVNAIADWQSGAVSAIVAPEEKLASLAKRLPDAAQSPIGLSGAAGVHGTRYGLLIRR